jgi:hypothetical protein
MKKKFNGKVFDEVRTSKYANGLLPDKLAKETASVFKSQGYTVRTQKVGSKRKVFIRYETKGMRRRGQ